MTFVMTKAGSCFAGLDVARAGHGWYIGAWSLFFRGDVRRSVASRKSYDVRDDEGRPDPARVGRCLVLLFEGSELRRRAPLSGQPEVV